MTSIFQERETFTFTAIENKIKFNKSINSTAEHSEIKARSLFVAHLYVHTTCTVHTEKVLPKMGDLVHQSKTQHHFPHSRDQTALPHGGAMRAMKVWWRGAMSGGGAVGGAVRIWWRGAMRRGRWVWRRGSGVVWRGGERVAPLHQTFTALIAPPPDRTAHRGSSHLSTPSPPHPSRLIAPPRPPRPHLPLFRVWTRRNPIFCHDNFRGIFTSHNTSDSFWESSTNHF